MFTRNRISELAQIFGPIVGADANSLVFVFTAYDSPRMGKIVTVVVSAIFEKRKRAREKKKSPK